MKEARYKTQYNRQYNTQYKTSAYDENTPTVTSTGTTLLQPVTSPIHSISSGVVNYPKQIEVMPYDELVKMQERLTALEKLILEGPTEPEAEREREVYDEVVKLRERVAVLEVVVRELKYLIEAGNR